MIDDNNEQQADNITVDMNTGERSDDVPSFEIIENEGVKYVAANQADLYKAAKSEELAAMQTEIDDTLNAIAEIDRINAVYERKAEMQKLIDQYGEDYDMTAVTDFENEAEFNEMMAYITATYQSSFGNPSAGFGAVKQPQADTKKTLYEYGQKMARQAYEKRRR